MGRWAWDVLSVRCPWDIQVDVRSQSEVGAGGTYLGVLMMAEFWSPRSGASQGAWLQADSEN